MMESIKTPLGYFGGVYVRQHYYHKAGDVHEGHAHNFDHITLVAQGSVRCEVAGSEPKDFKAPTFIVINKDRWHKFTALEDNTSFFCVFALRDDEGKISDIYSGDNSPYSHSNARDMALEEFEKAVGVLTETACSNCTGCVPRKL